MLRGVRNQPGRYWRVVAVLVVFSVVDFLDVLLLLRLDEVGFSVTEVIATYVTYNLVYAVASYPAEPGNEVGIRRSIAASTSCADEDPAQESAMRHVRTFEAR